MAVKINKSCFFLKKGSQVEGEGGVTYVSEPLEN